MTFSSPLRLLDPNQLEALDTPVDEKNILKARLRPRAAPAKEEAPKSQESLDDNEEEDEEDHDEDFVCEVVEDPIQEALCEREPWVRPPAQVSPRTTQDEPEPAVVEAAPQEHLIAPLLSMDEHTSLDRPPRHQLGVFCAGLFAQCKDELEAI